MSSPIHQTSGNGFQFTYLDDGSWLWKAIPFNKSIPHKEEPIFAVVHDIERSYQKEFDKRLASAVKDIYKYLDA